MRPSLNPGDTLLALRGGRPRRGQLRVFRDPTQSDTLARQARRRRATRGEHGVIFEARSDNPRAAGVVDSRRVRPGVGGGLVPGGVDGAGRRGRPLTV